MEKVKIHKFTDGEIEKLLMIEQVKTKLEHPPVISVMKKLCDYAARKAGFRRGAYYGLFFNIDQPQVIDPTQLRGQWFENQLKDKAIVRLPQRWGAIAARIARGKFYEHIPTA